MQFEMSKAVIKIYQDFCKEVSRNFLGYLDKILAGLVSLDSFKSTTKKEMKHIISMIFSNPYMFRN